MFELEMANIKPSDLIYFEGTKMIKDEIKNRISMALKDPVLQQGFEIICKENAELKGEADSVLNNWCKGDDPCPHLKKRDEQLTKAKEIIKNLTDDLITVDGEQARELKAVKEAEQFLNSEVKR